MYEKYMETEWFVWYNYRRVSRKYIKQELSNCFIGEFDIGQCLMPNCMLYIK